MGGKERAGREGVGDGKEGELRGKGEGGRVGEVGGRELGS